MADINPLTAQVLIKKQDGTFYAEGDRVAARDLVGGNVVRLGTVGLMSTDGTGKKYMVVRYGEEPFIEAFLATEKDIILDLPEDNIEAIEAWLAEANG
jgi:hypothetical protein